MVIKKNEILAEKRPKIQGEDYYLIEIYKINDKLCAIKRIMRTSQDEFVEVRRLISHPVTFSHFFDTEKELNAAIIDSIFEKQYRGTETSIFDDIKRNNYDVEKFITSEFWEKERTQSE